MTFRHTLNQSRKQIGTGDIARTAGIADRFFRNSSRQGSRAGRPATP